MKRVLLVLMVYMGMMSEKADAQTWVADTFDTPINPYNWGWIPPSPISTSNTNWFQTFITIKKTELQAKGIVPGMTIFGVAFNKINSNFIYTGAYAKLNIESRCGGPDSANTQNYGSLPSMFTNVNAYLANISTMYPTNNEFINGFNMPNTAPIGWLPFMFSKNLTYSGGTLQFHTVINMDSTAVSGKLVFGFQISNYLYPSEPNYEYNIPLNFQWNNLGGLMQNNSTGLYTASRPQMIIYHSPANQLAPCNNTPIGGIIKGVHHICWPMLFLFLDNASSGPGITYQWQYSTNNTTWTTIAGATGTSLQNNYGWNGWYASGLNSPTIFRCNVTCSNSGITTPSDTFLYSPYILNIDSINISVTGNTASFHAFMNDTTYQYTSLWTLQCCNGCYPNPLNAVPNGISQLTSPQHQYFVDGTYPISLIVVGTGGNSSCGGTDTLVSSVTIGCLGSPTFKDTIAASIHNICPGGMSLLKLQDTLPANYTTQWQYLDSTVTWTNLPNGNADSVWVSPTKTTIYRNVSTCTISGNKKISNSDYVQLPPVYTSSITYTQIGNDCHFNYPLNLPVVSYTWYFGDGDSTNNIINPTHHYNLAGNYQVMLVYSNNGCLDTAYTTVSITTDIDEVQGKLFSVSPNPFSEGFVITCPAAKGAITVTDAVGKTILTRRLSGVETNVDMKSFAKGIYMLRYENEGYCETVKVVKE